MILIKYLQAITSPATGEQTSILPWVIAGVGVLALGAFILLSVLQKKQTPPTTPTDTDNTPDTDGIVLLPDDTEE